MASDGIRWMRATSRKGIEYEIGVPVKAANDVGEPHSHGPDFGMTVLWSVANTWIDLPRDQMVKSGIERYNLSTQSGSFYDYRLTFANNQTYDFHFWDETGDSYRVNTFSIGEHYVRFNSDKPTIVYVTGS
ncbi:hypothetical protein PsYK624_020000 [Phanerochaete sordida]|uniref:Uncharacterized protein n=1 Tax=Phanerochaete sordida TaxID=48140 RepID=A0A9P3G1D5_9APHY|nr:hypothetical protein PsYK624_020000 [Phanerochaete sordida]